MRNLSIAESILGVLVLDEKNRIVERVLFPKNPVNIAERIARIESGDIIYEMEEAVKKTRRQAEAYIVESDALARNLRAQMDVEVIIEKPSDAGDFVRENLGALAVQTGFLQKADQAFDLMREVSTVLAKIRVTRAVAKRDQIVVQMINAMDELDKITNLLSGRLTEWYGLNFPEMNRIIDSHDTYAKIIVDLGTKEDITEDGLRKLGLAGEKGRRLIEAAESSPGTSMNKPDIHALQSLARIFQDASRLRDNYTETMEGLMGEVCPNIKAVAGSNLGARLIALAGGLERLAKFPASTVQVLGAEKALFRSLRTGSRPPKHGVIFQHQLIHPAPRWQRGKIARALAGKIAIAARIDAFTQSDASGKLKSDLEKRVKEIHEKYVHPPARQSPSDKYPRRGKFERKRKGKKR